MVVCDNDHDEPEIPARRAFLRRVNAQDRPRRPRNPRLKGARGLRESSNRNGEAKGLLGCAVDSARSGDASCDARIIQYETLRVVLDLGREGVAGERLEEHDAPPVAELLHERIPLEGAMHGEIRDRMVRVGPKPLGRRVWSAGQSCSTLSGRLEFRRSRGMNHARPRGAGILRAMFAQDERSRARWHLRSSDAQSTLSEVPARRAAYSPAASAASLALASVASCSEPASDGNAWADVDPHKAIVSLDENKTDRPRSWVLNAGVATVLAKWKERRGGEKASGAVFTGIKWAKLAPLYRAHCEAVDITRARLFEKKANKLKLRAHDMRAFFVTAGMFARRPPMARARRVAGRRGVRDSRVCRRERGGRTRRQLRRARSPGRATSRKCTGRDLNPYASRRRNLNPLRLPISPPVR